MGTRSQKQSPKQQPVTNVDNGNSLKLPDGLIGMRCTAQVRVEGKEVNCLLDTGSQVTTIPLSFYNSYLSHHPLQPLNRLLEVEGANGQAVPYLGYVELALKFPQEFLGAEAEVPTLALVVPDLTHVPQILIGTNTLDVLYADYLQETTHKAKSCYHGYRAVIRILEARRQQASVSVLGQVKVKGEMPEVVAAGSTVVLNGCVNIVGPVSETWVTVEPSASSSLPGGLLVASCLHSLPPKRNIQVPVVLKNETQVDLTIPPRAVLAEVHTVRSVIEGRNPVSSPVCKVVRPAQAKIVPDFGDSPLSSEWRERITDLVSSMSDVFALHDLDYGRTDKVKHHINLSDNTPFKQRSRPIHPQDVDAVRRHLKELLDAGVIRESESPFASPIVVVKKKNNDVRLCIDFRKLNSQTIKDAYALPNLEEAFSALTGSKWFSVLDLKSGFYQIEMEEADKHKTAFVCPLGFYEFNRMPQGVTNAPSSFQRLMERCMGDLNRREVLVFVDDLIVFSKTLEEHETRLLQVLKRLREYGLKLSPTKCKFFQTSVRYLGHIVSQNGVETDPAKTEALKTWPRPRNLKELKCFLGFAGYYRRFVKDFSKIIRPLNDLTIGYPPLQKNQRQDPKKSVQYRDPKEQFGDRWTHACQQAFDSIIENLTSAPVLGFADPRLPYVLTTDASITGLGAALYQEQEVGGHSKFSDYLYGGEFVVVTDSNPLTYILTSAKLDATSYRWLSALSTFNFKIQYRAGKQNLDADGLSRRPHGRPVDDLTSQKERERIKQFTLHHLAESEQPTILPAAVKALCERHQVYQNCDDPDLSCFQPTVFESLCINTNAVPLEFQQEDTHGLPILSQMSEEELRERQRADPELKEVIKYLDAGKNLKESLYLRRQDRGDVLYQLALPVDLRETVLTSLHNDMGHLGIERTLDLARSRFYWPRMAMTVEEKIKACERCVRRKTLPERAAPLVNIATSRPLELVCIDYLSLEPDRSNIRIF
ncbi:interleukin-1 receptor accessory protein-like 1-A [Pimephales promelas]|nr:interleukin-1 receptor accessory protein-like 1-A [Pimephales promelas]